MTNYISQPKPISDYSQYKYDNDDDTESVSSTDTDKPVEITTPTQKKKRIREGFENINPDKAVSQLNADTSKATSATKDAIPEKKEPEPKPEQSKITTTLFVFEFFTASLFSPPTDLSGKTIGERIIKGIALTLSRIIFICFLLIIGLVVKTGTHLYANEAFFPTDFTKPPYYPTDEEKAKYEPTRNMRQSCKNDPDAPFIGKFREPDQTYPKYLYYDGMDLPHADPCKVENVAGGDKDAPRAMKDTAFNRYWIQLSALANLILGIFSTIFNRITGFFVKSAEGVEAGAVELATVPETKLMDEAEQEAEKAYSAYIKGQEELAKIKQGANKTTTQQRGQGKQRGGANETAQTNQGPKHVYSTYMNPYAMDRNRSKEDIGWFYYPIFANSSKLSAIYSNKFFKAIFNALGGLLDASTKERPNPHALVQFIRIIFFALLGGILFVLSKIFFGAVGAFSFIFAIIPLFMAYGLDLIGVLFIWGLFPFTLGTFALGLNWMTNYGIIMWRTLYFLFHMFIRPLTEFNEIMNDFMDIIKKNPSGLLVMLLLISTLSGYQVAQEKYKNYVLIGVVLAVLIMGVNVKIGGGTNNGKVE